MSESECNSCQETWKKPDKRIKLIVKKRLPKQGHKSTNVLKPRSLNAAEVNRPQLKRHNPFSCSPRKKANIARPSKNQENIKLFQDLDKLNSPAGKITESQNVPKSEAVPTQFQQDKPTTTSTTTLASVENNKKLSRKLPLDWSLKTRIRFTSSQPFSWCSKLLSNQEAEGICNFVQLQDNVKSDQQPVKFQQNIMYWIHPVFPWLSLFPRLSSGIKLTSKVPNIGENVEIVDAMQASWVESFRSLFNLLRCGQCDYFYLCSSQSSMLFRAANIGGLSPTSVLITPTTKGMREAFNKEGIVYTLPLLDQSPSSEEDEDEHNENIDDNTEWLESMGVGKETLPQLEQSKIDQEIKQLRNIDHQGSSVALITGSHTQALFNYILNCKSLVSKTGVHTGIPPTLLSPVAFEGATLQSLSVKQGVIKQGKNLEQKYNLDISGPILPGNFAKLCKVFETTQDKHFTGAAKLLQATTPFNVVSSEQQPATITEQNYFEQYSSLHSSGLTNIKYDDGYYSWETS